MDWPLEKQEMIGRSNLLLGDSYPTGRVCLSHISCYFLFFAFPIVKEVKAALAVSGRRVLSARLERFDSVQLLLNFLVLIGGKNG